MKRPYQIGGTLFFLFAAFMARESVELKFYTTLGPGPGFFPFWLAVIMMLLSGIMVFQATFRQSDPMPADFFASKVGYLRALAICVSFVWAVKAMDPLGFRLTMLVFFLWLLLTLGRLKGLKGWIITVAVSIAGSWGAFWLFDTALKVPLPRGMFGF